MTDAVAKSFGYQLDFLTHYLRTNYNWESPESGFARYIFYRADSQPPFSLATDAVINSLEPRRLHQAPILAAVGYELASGRVFGESFLSAWANGVARLASREAFPSDRASFFYRPVELLGISLGVSSCPKVRSQDLCWLQNVLAQGEQNLVHGELWTFLLGIYAAKILSVSWKLKNLPLPEEMTIDELSLVKLICTVHSPLAQLLGFKSLESEIDKALLSSCITASVSVHDTSHAAVLYFSLQKSATQVFQANWEDYCQVGQSAKQPLKLIKFLCDRFHLVAGQIQSPHQGIEISDEYDIQDLLNSLSQLRSDTDAVVTKVIDTRRQKLGNQIINHQRITITGGNVTMSNNQNYVETMSERKININQSGASIGVGYSENVEANQLGGTINNYPSEQKQTLAEAAAEIQQLLQQLEQTYPTNTTTEQMVVATKAIERIESDSTWKQRVVNAVKEGGLQAFEKAIDNPVGAFIVGAIKGWQEAEIE
jgi:hypothetical protein